MKNFVRRPNGRVCDRKVTWGWFYAATLIFKRWD